MYSLKNSLSTHFDTLEIFKLLEYHKKKESSHLILILSPQENCEAEISPNRFKHVTPEFKEAEAPFLN